MIKKLLIKLDYLGRKPDVNVGREYYYSIPNSNFFEISIFLRKLWGNMRGKIWFPVLIQHRREDLDDLKRFIRLSYFKVRYDCCNQRMKSDFILNKAHYNSSFRKLLCYLVKYY